MVALPVSVLSGTRAFGGIVINEIYSTQPSLTNDWLELYNTASYPISIAGWTLYVDGVLEVHFSVRTLCRPAGSMSRPS